MSSVGQIEGYRKPWRAPQPPRLTGRENDVLRLVAEGKGNQEIGQCLGISHRTVKVHMTNIFEKLGVNRRTDAIMAFSSTSHHSEARAS